MFVQFDSENCWNAPFWFITDNNMGRFTWVGLTSIYVDHNSTIYLVARQSAKGTHYCLSMATRTVLYCWQLQLSQQQFKENALLRFHSNNSYVNAPQYYAIRTLPIVLRKTQSFRFGKVKPCSEEWTRMRITTVIRPCGLEFSAEYGILEVNIWWFSYYVLSGYHRKLRSQSSADLSKGYICLMPTYCLWY